MSGQSECVDWERICAVVDAQGFTLDNRFHFRELAIRNQDFRCCVEFNPEIFLHRLSRDKRRHLIYQINNIHGLPINPHDTGCFRSSQALTVLQSWHAISASPEKPYFGVKNPQLAGVLEQGNIPYICLNKPELNVPSLKVLDGVVKGAKFFCALHTRIHYNNDLRCALRKVNLIWEWKHKLPQEEPPAKKLKLSGENEIMEWLFANENDMSLQ